MAEKRPCTQQKIEFAFVFLRILKIFSVASHCKAATTIGQDASK
jgi:hypothetical protein